jgi:glycine/D-amino acid oxidase-like deaminating enzyme
MVHDCMVIGKGLIGSAAARYLAKSFKDVLIAGPDEPVNMEEGTVFSSHYDQARIQRITGTDEIWTLLNMQSLEQYPSLQQQSGITFHRPAGCLYVNPVGRDIYLRQAPGQAQQFHLQQQLFENAASIQEAFPYFTFPPASMAMYEPAPCGYINPRLLISAQLSLFQKDGGTVNNDVVTGLDYEKGHITLHTLSGNMHEAKKVLLCPGAFINFFPFIDEKLSLTLKSETTILARLSEWHAQQLERLPSLLYEIDIPEYMNIYLIQPILYPDGNYYLKMGCNLPGDIYFDSLEEIQQWFKSGNSDANSTVLQKALMAIMKHLQVEAWITKRCIVTFTQHRKPYIGLLNNRGLFVAAGGNGYSAMCSDALGRIAAHVVSHGNFPPEYPAEAFRPVFQGDRENV